MIKNLLITVTITATVIASLMGWVALPKKVEILDKKVEEKTTQNKDSVEKLAKNMDLFVLEQRTIQKAQERREELMLELLKK